MKPPPLILQIPEPCTQGWDTMQPTGCGRHCAACEKTVVDFTGFSDDALIAFFNNPKNKNACGHIWSTQLNRPLVKSPSLPAWFKLRWQKAAAFLVALQAMATHSLAQKISKPPVTIAPATPARYGQAITGRLLNWSTRQPVGSVTISFSIDNEGSINVITDSSGFFRLPLPEKAQPYTVAWKEQASANGAVMAGSVVIVPDLLLQPFEAFFYFNSNYQPQPLHPKPKTKYIVDGYLMPGDNAKTNLYPSSIESPIPVRRIDITPKPGKKQ